MKNAILKFTDAIYDALTNGNFSISVMLYFSIAFDTVKHNILLNKLCKIVIRDHSLCWTGSFLPQ